jgi:hypothetical protein
MRAVFLCPGVCHLVALQTVMVRCPRTYSGRASVLSGRSVRTVRTDRTDGRSAPSAFHGRPRTGRASGRVRAWRALPKRARIPVCPGRRPRVFRAPAPAFVCPVPFRRHLDGQNREARCFAPEDSHPAGMRFSASTGSPGAAGRRVERGGFTCPGRRPYGRGQLIWMSCP